MKKILILFGILFLSSCTLTERFIVEGVYESFNDIDHHSISKAKLELTFIAEDEFIVADQLNVITDYRSSKHYAFDLYFYIISEYRYVLVNVEDLTYQKGTPQTYIGNIRYESTYLTIDSSLTLICSDTMEIMWKEKMADQFIENRFKLHLIAN